MMKAKTYQEAWFPIKTARLLLREFRSGDYEDIHAYASDLDAVRFMEWGPNSPETTRERLKTILSKQAVWPRTDVNLAVELLSEARVIGTISLNLDGQRGAELGYIYRSCDWRKGYAYEAASALITLAFRTLRLHRIWATCDARNARSIALFQKLELHQEGCFRKDRKVRDGWRDTRIYAILEEEWAPYGSLES
jgi:ribosomal-protein-alanine N-acetyltransferase